MITGAGQEGWGNEEGRKGHEASRGRKGYDQLRHTHGRSRTPSDRTAFFRGRRKCASLTRAVQHASLGDQCSTARLYVAMCTHRCTRIMQAWKPASTHDPNPSREPTT
eukprot:8631767-Pyramimonas_sp.AAC.1